MADAPDGEGGARRADAQRNRELLLRIAAEALTEDPTASLNTVAKRANVGPGTLYRHFPNREALLLAVYESELAALCASVADLLGQEEPLDAFRLWSRRLAALSRRKHGLGEALTGAAGQAVISASWAPVSEAIRELLTAAHVSGAIPAEVEPTDVILLLSALWRVPPSEDGLAQADRILEHIVAALRCAPSAA